MKFIISLVILFFVNISQASECVRFLSVTPDEQTTAEVTDNFIAFLTKLIDEGFVSIDYLPKLLEDIQQNRSLSDPFDPVNTKSAHEIYQRLFQQYKILPNLNRPQLKLWAEDYLKKHKKIKREKDRAQDETKSVFQSIKFKKIKAGKFSFTNFSNQKIETELTHDFEVMTVLVTQKIWLDIMGYLPKKIKITENAIELPDPKGHSVKINPDHPINQISWWDAIKFANTYSRSQGLPEVYDTHLVDLEEDPNFGVLNIKRSSNVAGDFENIRKLIINAPNSNIYESKGYRLPTEAEQLYLLTNLGRSTGPFFGNIIAEDMPYYAVFNHSNQPNHEVTVTNVAEKAAFNIDGATFYDLYGLVSEYTSDWDDQFFAGGKDPFHPVPNPYGGHKSIPHICSRGGGATSTLQMIKFYDRALGCHPVGISDFIGFRLVRTVKK